MVITNSFGKVSLFDRPQAPADKQRGWSSQDIADLYRIGDQLTQLGFPVVVHIGLSDEDDPWAVFERDGTDEVIVHVARINAELTIVDVVRERIHRGSDFRSLSDKLLAEAPLVLPRVEERGNVVLHPRMVMTAFVAAAFVLSEFANPATAQAASFEGDADSGPQTKAEPGRALASSLQFDADFAEKSAGRDSMVGMQMAQAIGMSGLAASLAALSAHLFLGASENQTEDLENTGQETASLFDGASLSQSATPLVFDEELSLGDRASDTDYAASAQMASAETEAKPKASISVDIDDKDIVFEVLSSPIDVSLPHEEDKTVTTEIVALKRSFDQDFHSELVLIQLDPKAASVPETHSYKSVEVLDRVVASVTVLSQSQLSTFQLDGEAEGAIVIRKSDLTKSMVTTSDLIDSFPTSSSDSEAPPAAPTKQYQLVSELSQTISLTPEVANILVYAGGDVEVSGFSFGRDSIVFLEDITPPNWLTSVDIVGSDIVLVGHGGSVTLFDAVTTFI
jgi:hypothetical protein